MQPARYVTIAPGYHHKRSRVPIDFLTIGHITHDRAPEGFRLGGTVSFAAVTARRLGHQPAIVTRGSAELLHDGADTVTRGYHVAPPGSPLAGIPIRLLPSAVSTTFTNTYRDGQRTQILEALADPIAPEELPDEWRAVATVLLGPIAREIPTGWADVFPNSLVGITPQGWMRQWDEAGRVSPARWHNAAPFLQHADAVILSREDVGGDDAYLRELAGQTKLLVVTDGWHGAWLYADGHSYHVPPRPAREVDPTGAGDVFATAFLIRLSETGDPLVAARFANIVASISIEAPGMDAIPERAQVDAWLRQQAP